MRKQTLLPGSRFGAAGNRCNRYSGFVCIDTVINVKLMPQQDTSSNNGNDQAAAMASSMKTMNMIMPLMSAWFCFTLPSGLGLYWGSR